MSIRLFLHVCFWSLLTVSVGRASPTLVTSAGTILGVDGVVVGSATYNPRFVDGTCAAVYGACDGAHFTFAGANSTDTVAVAAAASALQAALISLSATDPSVYNGCGSTSLCEVLTPWWLLGPTSVWTTSLYVASANVCGPDVNSSENPATDTTGKTARVYVQWAPLTQDAPEPATLTLLGAALASMGAIVRRRHRA